MTADLDERVGQAGLSTALGELLPRFVRGVEAHGINEIPADGPLLVACNHPGTYEPLAIAAHLHRNDLKIIVSGIPLLDGLPHARRHFIFTPYNPHGRISTVREVIHHLEAQGSVLIFPRGNVEPDPEVMPGAGDELAAWSPSLDLILRKVPQARIVIAIASGVLAPVCLRHPLTWFRRGRIPRQKIAIFVQLAQQLAFHKDFGLLPRVTFGSPLAVQQLKKGADGLMPALVAEAKRVLAAHLADFYHQPVGPTPVDTQAAL